MTDIAFPASLVSRLDRATPIRTTPGVKNDLMDDDTLRLRTTSSTTKYTYQCQFKALESADKDTLTDFIDDNAANNITWTIDGKNYIGKIRGGYSLNMTGNRYNITFTYYATVV